MSFGNIYLLFGGIIIIAVILDLGLLSKKHTTVTTKKALTQTAFWIALSLGFSAFLFFDRGSIVTTKFLTAYLMEWSLSIDNIFVFILIFSFFKVQAEDAGRSLLVGILLAIVFRIAFISAGVELIDRFHWLMYVFGGFLIYTGIKLFYQKEDEDYNPEKSAIYKFGRKLFRITPHPPNGKFAMTVDGKLFFTTLTLVVLMLASTDIVFALDSIPTVVSLVRESANTPFTKDDILVIYSSNIFAVLGLRSLFFLLRNAIDAFKYLQHGIAVVLIFIGAKMLVEFFDVHISIYVSLLVIVFCLGSAILFSVYNKRKEKDEPKAITPL